MKVAIGGGNVYALNLCRHLHSLFIAVAHLQTEHDWFATFPVECNMKHGERKIVCSVVVRRRFQYYDGLASLDNNGLRPVYSEKYPGCHDEFAPHGDCKLCKGQER